MPTRNSLDSRKANIFDPFFFKAIVEDDTKDNSLKVSYKLLRTIARKNSIVGAIINTRIAQLTLISRPIIDKSIFSTAVLGYTIQKRDNKKRSSNRSEKRDSNTKSLTKFERKEKERLENFIKYMGREPEPGRDGFLSFMQQIMRDRLTLGISAFEVVYDNKGKPVAVYPVDAATIRYTDEEERNKGYYKQVVRGHDPIYFEYPELGWGVANPTTDMEDKRYGISEIEMAVNIIAAHLNAENYNSLYFEQGTTTKGILNIKGGEISDRQLENFRRAWYAMLTGTVNSWKTPILSAPNGIEFVRLSESNQDMEFSKWLQYLLHIICAVFLIDPAELSIEDRGAIATASHSLFNSSYQAKVKLSQDKGFKPLVIFLEDLINKYIIQPINPDFEFRYIGLEGIDPKEEVDRLSKEVQYFKTINEVRSELGLPELPYGDILLNPLWIQVVSNIQAGVQSEELYQNEPDMAGIDNKEDSNDNETKNNEKNQKNKDTDLTNQK